MHHSNRHIAARLILTGALLVFSRGAIADEKPPKHAGSSAQPGPSRQAAQGHNTNRKALKPKMPFGISAVNQVDTERVGKSFDTSDAKLNVYANPNTSGVTFRTSWADIEHKEGKFDYTRLDAVFANAEKHGKWVELILIPGFGTPEWALKDVQTGTFEVSYGRGKGTKLPLPVPWDKTYLSRWFTFLKAISDRYGDEPSFRMIAAAGPTSVSPEMSLPNSADDIAQWEKLGYTTDKYVDAWKKTFAAYSTTFPGQYFSLSTHRGLPIPDRTHATSCRDQVVALGLKYAGQFALEANGLNGSSTENKFGYREVRDHSGEAATGFMMTTSATARPARMGDSSNPADDLKESINKGLAPNHKGKVVNYLIIYENDIVNPAMQSVLQDGEQQLLKNKRAP